MRNKVAGNWGSTRGGRLRNTGAPWARLAALALAAGLLPAVAGAQGDDNDAVDNGKHCSATARATFRACGLSARADELTRAPSVSRNRRPGDRLAEAGKAERGRTVQPRARCALGDAALGSPLRAGLRSDGFDPDFAHPVNPNPFPGTATGGPIEAEASPWWFRS
jgi:hypothetical protein